MRYVPRPFDHLQIRSAMDDFPFYSHILFMGNEETESFLKILAHYGFYLNVLCEKKLLSLLPNDTLEKHSLNYIRAHETFLREEFLCKENHYYLLIPRISSLYPRFFSLFSDKEVRYQAPAILDRVDI